MERRPASSRWPLYLAFLLLAGAWGAERRDRNLLRDRIEDFVDANGRLSRAMDDQQQRIRDAEAGRAAEEQGRIIAESTRDQTAVRLRETWREVYQLNLRGALLALEAGNINALHQDLERAPQEFRGFEWHHLQRRKDLWVREYHGLEEFGMSVALSEDGARLAAGAGDGRICVWDVGSGATLASWLAHDDSVLALDFTADGAWLASGGEDGLVKVWGAGSGEELGRYEGHERGVTALAWHRRDGLLVTGSEDCTAAILDGATLAERHRLEEHVGPINDVDLSRDERRLATAGNDGVLRLWDVAAGVEEREFPGHQDWARAVALSRDGTRLLSGSDDLSVRLWDVATGAPLEVWPDQGDAVFRVSFRADGGAILQATYDGVVILREDGREVRLDLPRWHTTSLQDVDADAALEQVAYAVFDPVIRVWNRHAGEPRLDRRLSEDSVECVATSADGRWFAAGLASGGVQLRDGDSGALVAQREVHEGRVQCLAFAPDGSFLVSGGTDRKVRRWRLGAGTGAEAEVLGEHEAAVVGVAVRAADGAILSASSLGDFRLVDATGSVLMEKPGPPSGVFSVAVDPAATRVFWAADGGNLRAWDAATGGKAAGIRDPKLGVAGHVALSADGRLAVAVSNYGSVQVLDLAGEQLVCYLEGIDRPISQACFSPDGRRIATAASDATVKLWDAATGRALLTWKSARKGITDLVFAADGGRLFAAGQDGGLEVWETDLARLHRWRSLDP